MSRSVRGGIVSLYGFLQGAVGAALSLMWLFWTIAGGRVPVPSATVVVVIVVLQAIPLLLVRSPRGLHTQQGVFRPTAARVATARIVATSALVTVLGSLVGAALAAGSPDRQESMTEVSLASVFLLVNCFAMCEWAVGPQAFLRTKAGK